MASFIAYSKYCRPQPPRACPSAKRTLDRGAASAAEVARRRRRRTRAPRRRRRRPASPPPVHPLRILRRRRPRRASGTTTPEDGRCSADDALAVGRAAVPTMAPCTTGCCDYPHSSSAPGPFGRAPSGRSRPPAPAFFVFSRDSKSRGRCGGHEDDPGHNGADNFADRVGVVVVVGSSPMQSAFAAPGHSGTRLVAVPVARVGVRPGARLGTNTSRRRWGTW